MCKTRRARCLSVSRDATKHQAFPAYLLSGVALTVQVGIRVDGFLILEDRGCYRQELSHGWPRHHLGVPYDTRPPFVAIVPDSAGLLPLPSYSSMTMFLGLKAAWEERNVADSWTECWSNLVPLALAYRTIKWAIGTSGYEIWILNMCCSPMVDIYASRLR
jgi:hypothetical protein